VWNNSFCQQLNVDIFRQTEMHTTEPLVPEPSYFEAEIASEKLKSYSLPAAVLIRFWHK
jgi:hypothetical protein